ncbi:PREDICTED: COMM domain-containing protein 6-like [Priapulus caudatus]|uniref:COMM domain-containing protein 6 n=1 Tax=Priapulus caudatus TaxID=37621 RepID=A0ABM1FBY9_PRICU|nr:PREDICTED: COMM domain-containing protein 6-like [Priapulus caudatus]
MSASMVLQLQHSPYEFLAGAEVLNKCPGNIINEICQAVISELHAPIDEVCVTAICQKCHQLGSKLTSTDIQMASSALQFLFRSSAKTGVTAEELVKNLKWSMSWSDVAISVIGSVWDEHSGQIKMHSLRDCVQCETSVSKLIDLQWKLGIAMASDSCRNLGAPYVTVILKLADSSGKVKQMIFEMSIPKFTDFSRRLGEMATVMETM